MFTMNREGPGIEGKEGINLKKFQNNRGVYGEATRRLRLAPLRATPSVEPGGPPTTTVAEEKINA